MEPGGTDPARRINRNISARHGSQEAEPYNWTQTEVSQMKMLRKQGFTIREIAEKMNRSESSIKYKLYGREKSDGRS